MKSRDLNSLESPGLFSREATTLTPNPTSDLASNSVSDSILDSILDLGSETTLTAFENSASALEPSEAEDSAALAQQAQLEDEYQRAHQLAHQLAVQKAEKIAYNVLARREHSAQELEEKLLRKSTPVDIVKVVLRQMRDLDLQSDERFTENFVRSKINRGQGPVRIEMELKQRGISADLAEQHLAAEESFWLAQAKTLLARRGVGDQDSTMDSEEQWVVQQQRLKVRASHARFLASRGFRSNTIAKALPDTFT